jgi:hypothetical protein
MAIYLFPFLTLMVVAIGEQLRLYKTNRALFMCAILGLGLMAGLRFETGQDWPDYEAFFERVDLNVNPLDVYFGQDNPPAFELGFYLLTYVVKSLGGSCTQIFFMASMFCAYAIYRFMRRFSLNWCYVLVIYMSYSYMLLHFAQVRQSIAVGFFLLGYDHYLQTGKKLPALLIAWFGTFFQFTALMYILLLPLIFWWPRLTRMQWGLVICGLSFGALIFTSAFDAYAVLGALSGSITAGEKLAIYRETQIEQTGGQRIYAVYLALMTWYFAKQIRYLPEREAFVVKYAIASLFLSVLMTAAFSGSYVMYSRAYIIGCLFQGLAAALIFKRRKGLLHRTVFAVTVLIALISYTRMIDLNREELLPYQSLLARP